MRTGVTIVWPVWPVTKCLTWRNFGRSLNLARVVEAARTPSRQRKKKELSNVLTEASNGDSSHTCERIRAWDSLLPSARLLLWPPLQRPNAAASTSGSLCQQQQQRQRRSPRAGRPAGRLAGQAACSLCLLEGCF